MGSSAATQHEYTLTADRAQEVLQVFFAKVIGCILRSLIEHDYDVRHARRNANEQPLQPSSR